MVSGHQYNDVVAVIYARYSSTAQNDASIEQQIDECMEFARAHGIQVAATYADRAISVSKRKDKRPEFERMMRAAEKNRFQMILAYKSNRISRNMFHAMAYEDRLARFGVRVIYAKEEFGDNAAGRFAKRTMMNVNQFYSENMAEDIRRGMRDSAAQCKVMSAVPLGYKKGDDGRYAIDEYGANVVREIFQRISTGESNASIYRDLNSRGITTKAGKPWSKNSLHTILTNEKYIGVYQFEGIRIDGGVPQIVSNELFETVQNIVSKKATPVSGRRRGNGDYALTGKLFCGYCGSPMVGMSGTSKTGKLHSYYVCQQRQTKSTCHKKNVRRDYIEYTVAAMLKMYVLQDDVIEWIADNVMEFAEKVRKDNSQIDYLTEKKAESQKAMANIMKAIEAGIFNSQTQTRMLELEAEQKELDQKIAEEKSLIPDVTREQVVYWLQSFKNGSIDSPAFRKKLFVGFLSAVYIFDDKMRIVFGWGDKSSPAEVSLPEFGDNLSDGGTEFEVNGVRINGNEVYHNMIIRTPVTIKMVGRVFVLSFKYEIL